MARHGSIRRLAVSMGMVTVVLGACGDSDRTADAEPVQKTSAGSADNASRPTRLSDVPEGTPLKPGVYVLIARERPDLPAAVLDIPPGFEGGGAFVMATGKAFSALAHWNVTGTYRDPCSKQGHHDAGPSVEDLAALLTRQSMLAPTKPVPVSIGGHEGLYLEMTAPEVDYEQCMQHDVAFWRGGVEGDLYSSVAGALVRAWILDVDGHRAVLNTYSEPGATQTQLDALTQVIESARFVGADGSEI